MIKLHISKRNIFIYLCVILFSSSAMYYWTVTRYLYYWLVPMFSICIIASWGEVLFKNKSATIIFFLLLWITLSNILNGDFTKENVFRPLSIITLICIIDHYQNDEKIILRLRNGFILLAVMDIILTLFDLLQGGSTALGLLGHKNYHILVYLVTVALIALTSKEKHKYRSVLLIISIVFSVLMALLLRSTTSLICVIIYAGLDILIVKKQWKGINLYTVLIVDFFLFYIIVYRQDTGNLISLFLSAIGKDVSFTGRGIMWVSAWNSIAKMPIYGLGDNIHVLYSNYWGQEFDNHVHNFILHLIISGGWIYLGINIILFLIAAKNLIRSKTELSKELFLLITCFLITGMSEILVNMNNCIYPLLFSTSLIPKAENFKVRNARHKCQTFENSTHNVGNVPV